MTVPMVLPFMRAGGAGLISRTTPTLLRGYLSDWSALQTWRDFSVYGYLARTCGDNLVQVESGPHYMHSTHSRDNEIPFRLLLEYIAKRSGGELTELPTLYLAQKQLCDALPELSTDISVPRCLATDVIDARWSPDQGPRPSSTVITSLWIGPHGTLSPLHRDPYHGVLAQVVGRKYVRMYPADTPREALYPAHGTVQANTSRAIDPRTADPAQFSLLRDLPYYEVILEPGDALYQPRGTWHVVEALVPDPSISVSFWWDEARSSMQTKNGGSLK